MQPDGLALWHITLTVNVFDYAAHRSEGKFAWLRNVTLLSKHCKSLIKMLFTSDPEHYLQMGAILCTLHLMLASYDLQTHEATVANLKPPRPAPTSMAN